MASNRRKRKTPTDNYLNHLVREPEFEGQRRQFYAELQNFYRRKWSCALKLPRVSGSPLDLFELYRTVTGLGGWLKVSNGNRWFDVLELIGLSTETGVGEHAIRVIYMRQLARFEHLQTFGEDADLEAATVGPSNRSTRGKHYIVSLLSTNECPFNRGSDISAQSRTALDLPPASVTHTPYDRLVRSLQSGLPNEVDFAVNVCMLLSHPGPKFLKLERVPAVVDLLVAHAGIFDDGPGSYKNLYEGWHNMTQNRKFLEFWEAAVVEDKAMEMIQWDEHGGNKKVHEISETDTSLFAGLKPVYDPKDVVTSRIVQIASIIRNLSFEKENKSTLAASAALLKFIYVCVHSRWTPLQSMALDTLSNIASEMDISDPEHSERLEIVFRILSRCLYSEDKFHIIRALEALSGLCGNESNESVLCEHLEPGIVEKIMALVAVKDIMMCVYTLECLYQISELGTVTCQKIAERSHAVDMLISLATVEAVSFGPSGLMGMKVVEYGLPQPNTSVMPQSARAPPQPSPAIRPPSAFAVPARPSVPHPAASPAPGLMPPPAGSRQLPVPTVPVTNFPAKPGPPMGQALPTQAAPQGAALCQGQALPPRGGPQVAVLQDEKLDQLTLQWIRGNVVADPAGSVSRGELYAKYAEELRRIYASLAVSANAFSNLLRQVFPSISIRRTEEGTGRAALMHVDGIRYAPRSQTLQMASPSGQPFRCPSPAIKSSGPTSPLPIQYTAAATKHPNVKKALMNAPNVVKTQSPAQITSCPETAAANSQQITVGHATVSVSALIGGNRGSTNLNGVVGGLIGGGAPPGGLAGKHPNLADKLMSSTRMKANSVGTPENSLSGPPSPESLISGVGTESPAPNSPKSVRSVGAELSLPANCHLEVCEKAQEAKNVIEMGENHEAKIVRIGAAENSPANILPSPINSTANSNPQTDPVAMKFLPSVEQGHLGNSVKMNGEHPLVNSADQPINNDLESIKGAKKQQKGTKKNNNDAVIGEKGADNTLDDKCMEDIFAAAMKAATEVNGDVNKVNKQTLHVNGIVGVKAEPVVVAMMEAHYDATKSNDKRLPSSIPQSNLRPPVPPAPIAQLSTNLNPSALSSEPSAKPPNLAEELLKGSRRSASPSPNFESLSENLSTCQKNIQQLLESSEKAKSNGSQALAIGSLSMNGPVASGIPGTAGWSNESVKSEGRNLESELANACGGIKGSSPILGNGPSVSSTPAPGPPPVSFNGVAGLGMGRTTPGAMEFGAGSVNLDESLDGSGKKKIGRPRKGQEKAKTPRKPRTPKTPKEPKTPRQMKRKRNSVDSTASGGPDAKMAAPSPSPAMAGQIPLVAGQRWAAPPQNLRYMCEWNGCGRTYLKASEVYYHAATEHISDTTIQCKWPHCDKTIRMKWSMTTHVQDLHCSEMALKSAALRRYEISVTGQSSIPEPRSPPPHPGYSHHASIDAIRRHAFNNIPKDLTEENEGPVTKSIRLTSCLILRNLARYSSEGRRILKHHEGHLSWLALSQLESASALSQCLAELNSLPNSPGASANGLEEAETSKEPTANQQEEIFRAVEEKKS